MAQNTPAEPAPLVMLAPMAGITDLPFRSLVLRFGASLVVSEMVASQDLMRARRATRAKAELGLGLEGSAVQLAGRDPYWIGEAARFVADAGARVIDINMGCPAKKVTGGQSGSALLRDLDLAMALVRAVVGAVSVPVTLKTRLGWDDTCQNGAKLARRAAAEGIKRLTIHGRTRCQFYKGQANWAAISEIVQAVDIPVIANGDIVDLASARRALAVSGAAGVMIGRGVQGKPWLLAQIRAELAGGLAPPAPSGAALCEIVCRHYRDMLAFYGASMGGRAARKHLGWYMDAAATPKALRSASLTQSDPERVIAMLPAAFAPHHAKLSAA